MVRGIEFVRERSAPGRYIATLNVVFQPDPVKAWLGQAGVKIAETVSRAGAGHPAVEGQGGRRAARRPQRLARGVADARHRRQRRAGDGAARRPARPERRDGRGALCRRRLRALPAERALSRADHRRGDRRGRQGQRAADRQRPALRRADRRAQRDPAHDDSRIRPSSPPRPSRSTRSSTSSGAASPRCAAIRRTRSTSTCRSGRSATGCRCASGWAACRRSKSVVVRKLESDRAELRLEYFGTTDELQRTLASAGLALDKEADKWRLQVR